MTSHIRPRTRPTVIQAHQKIAAPWGEEAGRDLSLLPSRRSRRSQRAHTDGRGKAQHLGVPGWPYSFMVDLETGRGLWTAPLDAVRLAPVPDPHAAHTQLRLRPDPSPPTYANRGNDQPHPPTHPARVRRGLRRLRANSLSPPVRQFTGAAERRGQPRSGQRRVGSWADLPDATARRSSRGV